MKLLIDMNLSPEWVEVFASEGLEAVHWSSVGASSASDKELMAWAKRGGHIVLTHDLDFGDILKILMGCAPYFRPVPLSLFAHVAPVKLYAPNASTTPTHPPI